MLFINEEGFPLAGTTGFEFLTSYAFGGFDVTRDAKCGIIKPRSGQPDLSEQMQVG